MRTPNRDREQQLNRQTQKDLASGKRKPIDGEKLQAPVPKSEHHLSISSLQVDQGIDAQIVDINYQISCLNHEKKKLQARNRRAWEYGLRGTERETP